jgi:hypothetical protein
LGDADAIWGLSGNLSGSIIDEYRCVALLGGTAGLIHIVFLLLRLFATMLMLTEKTSQLGRLDKALNRNSECLTHNSRAIAESKCDSKQSNLRIYRDDVTI